MKGKSELLIDKRSNEQKKKEVDGSREQRRILNKQMNIMLESIGNLERKGQSGETTALFAQNYNPDDIEDFKKKVSTFVSDGSRPQIDVNTLTGRETVVPGAID
ncbi:MAG: hypothetical protein ACK521_07825 [bacterium]|jgi:hypothetical protein